MPIERFVGDLSWKVEKDLNAFLKVNRNYMFNSASYSHLLLEGRNKATSRFQHTVSLGYSEKSIGSLMTSDIQAKIFEGDESSTTKINRYLAENNLTHLHSQDSQIVLHSTPGVRSEVHCSTIVFYRVPPIDHSKDIEDPDAEGSSPG